MTHALEARGLAAGYDGRAVVHDLDLHVDPGELVALLGRNGAGKTTTMLALAGYLPPLRGTVELFGRGVDARHPERAARRGLGFVPQGRALAHELSARENLRLAARGRSGRVDAALELLPELVPVLDRRTALLSGGEQQMLAIGRALASSPRALAVDELSIGLAPVMLQRVLDVVRGLADRGVAVLVVEQHVASVLAVADRAYVLRRGRLVFTGTARELAGSPGVLEAGYLGEADDPGRGAPSDGVA